MLKRLKRWYYFWSFLFYFNVFCVGLNLGVGFINKNPANFVVACVCLYSVYISNYNRRNAKIGCLLEECREHLSLVKLELDKTIENDKIGV